MLQDYEYEFDEILEQVKITGTNSEANSQHENLRQQSSRQHKE